MNGQVLVTIASFLGPAAVVAFISLRFWKTLDRLRLYEIFIQVFTLFAAAMVIIGAIFPQSFQIIGANRAFLIVVSLSAVVHSITAVASMIEAARSRSHGESKSHS